MDILSRRIFRISIRCDVNQPSESRTIHCVSVVAKTTTAATMTVTSPGTRPIHRPRIPEAVSQGPPTRAIMASSAPPALACNAATTRPRTTCDHDVVMPQAGQRIPHQSSTVQGGKPSCRCVPSPLGLGESHKEIANSTSSRPPAAVTARRSSQRQGALTKTAWATICAGG